LAPLLRSSLIKEASSANAFASLRTAMNYRLMWSPRDIIQTLKMSLQTAAVGPGGVEILVVIVLFNFLKGKNKRETFLLIFSL